MSKDSAPAAQETDQEPDLPVAHSETPSLGALFLAFARMSLAGFGGVLVFARQAIVDQLERLRTTVAGQDFVDVDRHRLDELAGHVGDALERRWGAA